MTDYRRDEEAVTSVKAASSSYYLITMMRTSDNNLPLTFKALLRPHINSRHKDDKEYRCNDNTDDIRNRNSLHAEPNQIETLRRIHQIGNGNSRHKGSRNNRDPAAIPVRIVCRKVSAARP